MTRLFVAAWPPPDLATLLGRICPPGEPGVRPVPVENLHVTLRFLGDVDRAEAVRLLAGAAFPDAVADVGPGVQRFGRGQLVVPVTGVDALARGVDDAIDALGAPRRHPFVGHITVARTRRGARSSSEDVRVASEFPIDEIRLVESRLDPGGSSYSTVATMQVG